MIKIAYLSTIYLPSRLANRMQTIKTCEAFAKKGQIFLFICKKYLQDEEIFKFYGIQNRFPVIETKGHIIPLITTLFQYIRIIFQLKKLSLTHIYTREPPILVFALILKKLRIIRKVFFEAHEIHSQIRKASLLLEKIDGLIVITYELKKQYMQKGFPEEDILVAADGVDLRMFSNSELEKEPRFELAFPSDKNVICYAGHLYDWKGAHVLARSMKHLANNFLAYFVGGTESDVQKFNEFVSQCKIPNVVVVGHMPPSAVPKYLAGSHVLVLPNLNKGLSQYTSPLKLFEYMAAKRPIVASDLPALREVLRNEENAILVEPNNPIALAEGIERVIIDKELAKRIAKKAFQDVQKYTWDKRAERILEFVDKR